MRVTQLEELISTLRSINSQGDVSFSQQALITAQPQSYRALDQPRVSPTLLLSPPPSPNDTQGLSLESHQLYDMAECLEEPLSSTYVLLLSHIVKLALITILNRTM